MNTKNSQDPLKKLFAQLPKEKLPTSFRSTMMQQIMNEAVRMKKRSERLSLAAIITASVVMLTLGVSVFIYMDIPQPTITWPKMPSLTTVPFYVYIGALTLLLLFGDYQVRKAFKRRHKD